MTPYHHGKLANTKRRFLNLCQSHRSTFIFLALMLIFRSAIADWNHVPTGSMKPTILEGDQILINKMAYDIRIPFTLLSAVKLADPQRGDIIIFESSALEKRLVKRVVGIPGDAVSMNNNQLIINGEPAEYIDLPVSDYRYLKHSDRLEKWEDREYFIRARPNRASIQPGVQQSSFATVTVPEGHYLVLGDNRDNSTDSRIFGFVPRGEIIGQSSRVAFSLNYDNYWLPRTERFFKLL